MELLKNFLREEDGQDLVEYTLILAFVALASAALLTTAGESVRGLWNQTSTRLEQASTAAAKQ